MALTTREVPGRLEPSTVTWGRRHCRSILFVADVSSSLNNTYFDLNSTDSSFSEVKHYVWFNVASAGTDPAISGKTGIEVAIAANDSAITIAAAVKTAVDALTTKFKTSSVDGSGSITIENLYIGPITDETDSGSAGVTYTVDLEGIGGNLGDTTGGITFNMETSAVEIKSDQKGDYVLDEVFTGAALSMDMSLLEMTAAKWAMIIGGVAGDNFTPSGGTEVTGMGTDKTFKNATSFAGELVLKPLSTLAGDNSRNITFWLCAPVPSSINFSGTDVQAMSVTFKAYFDQTKNSKVNMFVFGDSSQSGFEA
jgi:hypothetical protein